MGGGRAIPPTPDSDEDEIARQELVARTQIAQVSPPVKGGGRRTRHSV